MKRNTWGGAYEAPRIEWLDVAVEAGFATSDASGAATQGFSMDDSQDDQDLWN